jgi:hypothetical protein
MQQVARLRVASKILMQLAICELKMYLRKIRISLSLLSLTVNLLFRRKVDELHITVDYFQDRATNSDRVEPGNYSYFALDIIHLDSQGLLDLINVQRRWRTADPSQELPSFVSQGRRIQNVDPFQDPSVPNSEVRMRHYKRI